MASTTELDRNAIFEKFASIKRMHDEVGKKQTEDYEKRLQKLKEDESNYMAKLISQPIPNRSQYDEYDLAQNSARRDLFSTTKNLSNPTDIFLAQHNYTSEKSTNRISSHYHDQYDNNDHEWNVYDDIQPLNLTDNDILEERTANRLTNDDESDDSYLTAYHQLLQNHQQQMMAQHEQENMLSTIFEASCEDATPMTSLLDVHQQQTHISPALNLNTRTNHIYENNEENIEEDENEDDDYDEDELTARPIVPSTTSIDDIPLQTIFSKNENLKYSDYVQQKLQTEKDESYTDQNLVKEKRPFLRKRQGLAHYQAPPKRRQPSVKPNDSNTNTKNDTVKRPTSANNHSRPITSNQRARSNSSSATVQSGRQTPTAPVNRSSQKSKQTKLINNQINSGKNIISSSNQNNLLGKVDLDEDDDDDLLSKYQTKKTHADLNQDDKLTSTLDKINSNIQTIIDTKWNAHKISYNYDEENHELDDDLYSRNRQRTSSRSSGIQSKVTFVQPKKELDDFEKLEQYAEEHPSMISTASYVEKVVFKDSQSSKTADVFVNRLTQYQDEEVTRKTDEINELSMNPNRIRQRKVIPLKTKTDTRIEQIPVKSHNISDNDDDDDEKNIHDNEDDDDDDDFENHKWDDVGVAKVIPVVADEYNSDSGISSFKTDFPKPYHQQKKDSARSSDFGDDHSWAERPHGSTLNTLMLNTFPGLRQTVQTQARVPPPKLSPPPPPPPVEQNQDYSRLVREKAKELEKQIELFEKENAKLQSLCNERNLAIKKLKQDRDEFEKQKKKELDEFNQMKEEEMKKFRHEKRLFEQHRQQLRDHPDKREREEIETLKKQVVALQEDLKQRETRWSTTVNRLKERIETLEYENAELKQEKEIIERKRLELVHQIQTMSKQTHDDISISMTATNRKPSVEPQQLKQRPKSAVPSVTNTNKSQPLPKTMVVRNSEPSTKPKVTSNGRRTPTAIVGVNGIKNNVDVSRKLSSLPTTKRLTSATDTPNTIETVSLPTVIDQPIIMTQRTDSAHDGSEENIHRFDQKIDDEPSSSYSTLMNTERTKSYFDDDEPSHSATIDYKSLLTMATRTSSTATTILKRHQETVSLEQPIIKRQPFTITNHETVVPTARLSHPLTAKTITFKENLPTQSNDGFIDEIRHNDGRVERIRSDSSRQILFPNGSKQEISADGKEIRVQFYNGDYKEKLSDGRCIYKYASTNTTETEYSDGTRIYEFPNGQIEKHLPDGRQEHTLPDKTKNIYLGDGTIISIKPNGEKLIQHSNQTKEIHTNTFKRKLFPNGSILTIFNTGEQEIRYANGKIKVKDAHGNIILEKKASNK